MRFLLLPLKESIDPTSHFSSFPVTPNVLKRVARTCRLRFFFLLSSQLCHLHRRTEVASLRAISDFRLAARGGFAVLVLSYQQHLTVPHVFSKAGSSLSLSDTLAALPLCSSPLQALQIRPHPILSLKTLS